MILFLNPRFYSLVGWRIQIRDGAKTKKLRPKQYSGKKGLHGLVRDLRPRPNPRKSLESGLVKCAASHAT